MVSGLNAENPFLSIYKTAHTISLPSVQKLTVDAQCSLILVKNQNYFTFFARLCAIHNSYRLAENP